VATTVEKLMSIQLQGVPFSYSDQQSMLYALGVGMARDPLDEKELAFAVEGSGGPKTVATMATVLTSFNALRTSGIDYSKVLHAEQRLTMHRPLPPAADIVADYGVVGVVDKGPAKGLFVYTETRVRTARDNQPLYTAGGTILARGDGGIRAGGASWVCAADPAWPVHLWDRVPLSIGQHMRLRPFKDRQVRRKVLVPSLSGGDHRD
jgi:hypothetical protein